MQSVMHLSASRTRQPLRLRVAAAVLLLALVPSRAAAYGSYGSKIETGSAIGLFAVGGLLAVPTAFVLVDDPLTTQRVVGRSLVIAGGLVMIAFGAYYFISDDPLWIPHALGWGIGGALSISGFVCWVADEDPGEGATEEDGQARAPAVETEPGGAGATRPPGDAPAGDGGEALPPATALRPEGRSVGLAPWLAPGGAGLVLAAVW